MALVMSTGLKKCHEILQPSYPFMNLDCMLSLVIKPSLVSSARKLEMIKVIDFKKESKFVGND